MTALARALLVSSLASLACACAHTQACEGTPIESTHARVVELAHAGETTSVLARPSAEVVALAGGDCYRVVLEGPHELTVVLLDEAEHVRARIHVEATEHAGALTGVALELDDVEANIAGRLELWSLADRVHGSAQLGGQRASWRARLEQDGRLAAERWQVDHHDERATAAIRRARAIGSDLAGLVGELEGADAETIASLELALELALRAYEGRGRSELPVWSLLADE